LLVVCSKINKETYLKEKQNEQDCNSYLAFLLLLASSGHAAVVGEWHLDGNANDTSGNANHGTEFGGASYTIGDGGQCGEALILDGIDDYVEVGYDGSLDVTSAYTIEAWVNLTDVPSDIYRPILFRGTTNYNDIEVYVQANSKDLIVAHNRPLHGTPTYPGPNFDFVGFADPPLGTWFHLAVTFDGTDVRAYYDGVFAGVVQKTTAMITPLATSNGWWIGKVDHNAFGTFGTGNTQLFKGMIDEVRIYDNALTLLEIEASAGCGVIEKDTEAEDIGICLPGATTRTFEINYSGPDALIIDTVPAEFEILSVTPDDNADFFPAGKGPNSKSATIIAWWVDTPAEATLTVEITTRQSPGGGHKNLTFKPTSCGDLYLNSGATAYEADALGQEVLDEFGDMIPIAGTTAPLTVQAVCGAKPCAPTGLVVSDAGATGTLELSWNEVCIGDDVVYNIYRDDVLIVEGYDVGASGLPYVDGSRTTGDEYCYAVEAEYDPPVPGLESDKSEEVCETAP